MPRFAEFFAGIGLVRMGLERHGWQIAFANDNDPGKYAMYRNQFPGAEQHFILDDINTLKASHIPTVDMATASFPCNDLSLAGAMAGLNGAKSRTFWSFTRILEQMGHRKPPIILIENVIGFLKSHNGSDFEIALHILNDIGYSIDCFIVDAAHFVPQSRVRLFIVGVLNQSYQPSPTNCSEYIRISDARPRELVDFICKHPEISWNVRSLPCLPRRESSLCSILEDVPESAADWWNQNRTEYLLEQMSDRHRKIAHHMIHSDLWSYGTVFRRMRNGKSTAELRTDGIAGCLRTPRGGSAKQILFKAGYGTYSARLITPTECARLMGAENYQMNVSRDQALFGFGDAVCVPVIGWIAQHYLNPLMLELTWQQQLLA